LQVERTALLNQQASQIVPTDELHDQVLIGAIDEVVDDSWQHRMPQLGKQACFAL